MATVGSFLALDAIHDATHQSPVYDYGVNEVYQGDEVYVDGQPTSGYRTGVPATGDRAGEYAGRLKQPEVPNAPQNTSEEAKES